MKNGMVAFLTGISIAALLAGGCANTAAVKKEEPIVPPVAAEKIEPAKPVEQPKPVEQLQPAQEIKPVEQTAPAEQVKPAEEQALNLTDQDSSNQRTAGTKFDVVYFDFDKADLRQDTRDILAKNAETILKALPGAKIQIEGHCDERGSAEYNLALGEHRAKSVKKYLVTLGVKPENLSVISYGKEKPAVSGNDEASWAKNRRAEFNVVK